MPSLGKTLIATNGIGLIAYVLLPLLLVLAYSVLLSAASVLDPLHAKEHVASIWTGFALISIFTLAFSAVACTLTALIVSRMAERENGQISYLLAAIAGLFVHWLLIPLIGYPIYFASRDELLGTFVLLFAFFATLSGPFMGVICWSMHSGRRSYAQK